MSHEKNSSETSRSMVETERFYIKLIIPICTNENFSHPTKLFNFVRTSLSLLLDTIDTLRFSFFDTDFFFNIEIKLKQRFSQNTQEKLLYCIHCHTMSEVIWFHYFIIVNYDFITQSFLTRRRNIVKSWDL